MDLNTKRRRRGVIEECVKFCVIVVVVVVLVVRFNGWMRDLL